jgi:hypothetical protein
MKATRPTVYPVSSAEYLELRDSDGGICLSCGEHADGCEPDAERYECEACGEHAVYGIEQALIMGRIDITD